MTVKGKKLNKNSIEEINKIITNMSPKSVIKFRSFIGGH